MDLSAQSEQAAEYLASIFEEPKKRRKVTGPQLQLERALGVA